MRKTFKRVLWWSSLALLNLVWLGVTGCGGSSILLGQPGQPTLVFIYTDG